MPASGDWRGTIDVSYDADVEVCWKWTSKAKVLPGVG